MRIVFPSNPHVELSSCDPADPHHKTGYRAADARAIGGAKAPKSVRNKTTARRRQASVIPSLDLEGPLVLFLWYEILFPVVNPYHSERIQRRRHRLIVPHFSEKRKTPL